MLSRISVIVPVYNTKEYLDECISSIIAQSWPNLQIILVDDGSTDGSGDICDAWAQRDSRIQVIHQENAGVSAARNAALDVADGAWISFVDSDDVLFPNAYSNIMKHFNGGDLIMGQMVRLDEHGEQLPDAPEGLPDGFTRNEFLHELFQEKRRCYLGYVSDKMFRREIIQKQRLCFNSKIRLNEDRLFVMEYLLCSGEIFIHNEVMYGYRQRSSSVMETMRRNRKVTDSEMTVLDSFAVMLQHAQIYSDELYHIVSRKAFSCCLDMINRTAREDTVKRRAIRRFFRKNTIICAKAPGVSLINRVKIVAHWFLER